MTNEDESEGEFEGRPHQELIHILAKSRDGKHFANEICKSYLMHTLQVGFAQLLAKAKTSGHLSQDACTELFYYCYRHLFASQMKEFTLPEETPPKLELISSDKKIYGAHFDRSKIRFDLSGLPPEDETFSVSKVYGLASTLKTLHYPALCELSPHLLGLCKMQVSKDKFCPYTSCYSLGGTFMNKHSAGWTSKRLNLHKQMIANGNSEEFDKIFMMFVDSILEDLDYLKHKENEYFFLGFLFTPINFVHTERKATKIMRPGGMDVGAKKTAEAQAREDLSNPVAFRWKTSEKHITVDYIKAHKRAFCSQMKDYYFTTGSDRRVLTFHFLYKHPTREEVLTGRTGVKTGQGIPSGERATFSPSKKMVMAALERNGHGTVAHADSVYECNMTFHLFVQDTKDKSWGAYYTYPRWLPLLDGVFLSAKFCTGLSKGVSFKKKEVKTGFFGGKKEDPETKGKTDAELWFMKAVQYQLPKVNSEIDVFFMEKLKELLSTADFQFFFVNLLRINNVTHNAFGESEEKTLSDKDLQFMKDCIRFIQDPLVSTLHMILYYLGLLLRIGKRNNFAQHLWAKFLEHFITLMIFRDCIDINLYFLYPVLEGYLNHFMQQSIYTVTLEILRTVYNLLQAVEWCTAILLLQSLHKDTMEKIDVYLNSSNPMADEEKTAEAPQKRASFLEFVYQKPWIPTSGAEKYKASSSVARNFPPSVQDECQLLYFISRQKIDVALARAFKPLCFARPIPGTKEIKAAFLRGYLIETLKPVILQNVYANKERTTFLKDLVFMGLSSAYANKKSMKQMNQLQKQLLPRLEKRKKSNFLAPNTFHHYPSGSPTNLSDGFIHQALDVNDEWSFSVSAATTDNCRFYFAQEDLHFHNLFMDKVSLEFIWKYSKKIVDLILRVEPEEIDYDEDGFGAGATAHKRAHVFASIGPTGLACGMAQNSKVFPNLLCVEFFVDTIDIANKRARVTSDNEGRSTTLGGVRDAYATLAQTPRGLSPNGNSPFNFDGSENLDLDTILEQKSNLFTDNVNDIVTKIFQNEEWFSPIMMVTSSNKQISLVSSEFSKDMLDSSTQYVWIDTFFFLEKGSIPQMLIDAKIDFLPENKRDSMQKSRYIRVLIYIGQKLITTSPRYYFQPDHPGLDTDPDLYNAELSKNLTGVAKVTSPQGIDMEFGSDIMPLDESSASSYPGSAKPLKRYTTREKLPEANPFGAFVNSMMLPGQIGSPGGNRDSVSSGNRNTLAFDLRDDGGRGGRAAGAGGGGDFRSRQSLSVSQSASASADGGSNYPDPLSDPGSVKKDVESPFKPRKNRIDPEAAYRPDFSRITKASEYSFVSIDPDTDLPVKKDDNLSLGQSRENPRAAEQRPPTLLLKGIIFGVSQWNFLPYETLVNFARSLHPPDESIFLQEDIESTIAANAWKHRADRCRQATPRGDHRSDKEGTGRLLGAMSPNAGQAKKSGFSPSGARKSVASPIPAPASLGPRARRKKKLKQVTLDPRELRVIARKHFTAVSQWQDRLTGLFDSWIYLIKYCILELDTIIRLCGFDTMASDFGALQDMWMQFRVTLRDDLLHSDFFILPLFCEIQHECLMRTVDFLDSFAIPSYDEDQLREWLRIATNCRSILESMVMLAQSVWLHATSESGLSGYALTRKDKDFKIPVNL